MQIKSCLSRHVLVAWHICTTVCVCECVRVCKGVCECAAMGTFMSVYGLLRYQVHNCAGQGMALDFSGENAAALP